MSQDNTFVTSSGVTLELRAVPPFVLAEAQSQLEDIEPPLEETNLGPTPNAGNKEYQRKLKSWNEKLNILTYYAYLDFGVKRFPLPEEAAQKLDEIKQIFREPPYRKELDYSDWSAYLTMILIPDTKEAGLLVQKIKELSMPSAAQVEAQRDSFQPDVAGRERVGDQSSTFVAVG